MKFLVEYTQNNVECSIDFEAADLQTCKKAVNQWRANKLKGGRKDKITIDSISEIK